jgi:hypothetical protein
MNFQERLIQFFEHTNFWQDLDEEQKANVGNIVRWARSLGHDGAEWIARILQRFMVVMSEDEPGVPKGTGKWAKRSAEILKMYEETRVVRDFFFFAKPDNQFKVVFARYSELAQTNQIVAKAIADIQYKDANGKDLGADAVYDALNSVGEKISKLEKLPQGKLVVALPDGSKWVELDSYGCQEEGELMRHCGNMGGLRGDVMWSYRVPSNVVKGCFEPKLTFIYNPKSKSWGEMKAKANTKAVSELHPAILGALKTGKVHKLIGSGYRPEVNFSLNDLNDQLFTELTKAQPELVKNQLTAADKYQKLDAHHRDLYKKIVGESDLPGRPGQEPETDLEGDDEPENDEQA